MAYWNLSCLGQALLPLIADQALALAALESQKTMFPREMEDQLRCGEPLLISPQKVEGEYVETAFESGVAVFIRAAGDWTQLSGKTIYALVEDPDSLTGGVLNVSIDSNPPANGTEPNAVISLGNRQMNTPGHFQGEFKVHACLDRDCSRPPLTSRTGKASRPCSTTPVAMSWPMTARH